MTPIFSKSSDFQTLLTFGQKICGLLRLVKIKVLNFIGKSLNLAPLLYRRRDASDTDG